MKDYTTNIYGLRDYVWDVQLYLMKKYGCFTAEKIIDPLNYWINTGRILTDEARILVEVQPYRIGRVLAKHYPGSIDEAVRALKEYVQKVRQA